MPSGGRFHLATRPRCVQVVLELTKGLAWRRFGRQPNADELVADAVSHKDSQDEVVECIERGAIDYLRQDTPEAILKARLDRRGRTRACFAPMGAARMASRGQCTSSVVRIVTHSA